MINSYLKYIQEKWEPPIKDGESGILYHGSPTQNLKIIDPKKSDKQRMPNERDYGKIYGSWDKRFAAMFVHNESFRGSDRNDWTVIMRYETNSLNKPCSIYTIKSNWYKPKGKNLGPELYSKKICKVITETKYKSVKECWKQNKIKFMITNNDEKFSDIQLRIKL